MIEIRNIVGETPFDRDGFHATGREVLQELPNGKHAWFAEYEDDFYGGYAHHRISGR